MNVPNSFTRSYPTLDAGRRLGMFLVLAAEGALYVNAAGRDSQGLSLTAGSYRKHDETQLRSVIYSLLRLESAANNS